MPSWDVQLIVNVAGVGERTVLRVIDAPTAEDAIDAAKRDLVTVSLRIVRPTPVP